MATFNYTTFRRDYMRRKAQTIYERLADDAEARRQAILHELKPLTRMQLADRDDETTPQQRRLRPTEYAAFPYRDRRYDYTASNSAGEVEATGWCFSGKHRVPVSQLYVKGRVMALSCAVCRARADEARKIIHKYRRAA